MVDKKNIINLVDKVINKCGTRNPYKIAKQLGIDIIYVGFKKQKGVYKIIKRNRFIFLSTNLDEIMQKIVLFHEIGHDLLHRDVASKIGIFQEFNLFNYRSSRMEYEANMFAAEISLPTDAIMEYIELGYTSEQIATNMQTDINLVALKLDILREQGYKLNRQDYSNKFLKG